MLFSYFTKKTKKQNDESIKCIMRKWNEQLNKNFTHRKRKWMAFKCFSIGYHVSTIDFDEFVENILNANFYRFIFWYMYSCSIYWMPTTIYVYTYIGGYVLLKYTEIRNNQRFNFRDKGKYVIRRYMYFNRRSTYSYE